MSKLIPKCQNNDGNTFGNLRDRLDDRTYYATTSFEPVVTASNLEGISGFLDGQFYADPDQTLVIPNSVEIKPLKEAGNADKTGIRKGVYHPDQNGNTVFTPVIDQEKDANTYSANQAGASVSGAMDKAGKTLLPYTLGLGNPLSFANSMIGGFVADETAKLGTDATGRHYTGWGDMVHDKTGINEAVADFTNPGYLINPEVAASTASMGRSLYNVGKYTAKRGTWYAPAEYAIAHSGPGKRAVELAMCSSSSPNPTFEISEALKNPKAVRGALSYTLFGDRGGLNTYLQQGLYSDGYNGSLVSNPNAMSSSPGSFDMVGAYLYGEQLPYLKRSTGYGVHSDYIKTHYPNKNIPVYEIEGASPEVIKSGKVTGASNGFDVKTPRGKETIDVAGHLVEHGKDFKGNSMIREQDIWKFNPDDYKARWDTDHSKLLDFGLNTVNEAGTPVIIRTPWELANQTTQRPF